MAAKLKLRDISKSFVNNGGRITVLKDISFDVEEGEVLCILGPSGCGKSTLLRLIAGFDNPDSGEIIMGEKAVLKPDSDRIMIFQDFNQLFPWKTVIDNIIFPLKVNRKGGTYIEREKTAGRFLEMVELGSFSGSYPHQLSGGMKQRAAIARALSLNPAVLLMDEPFGSLDALTRTSMQKMLLDIWAETGVTIIFVTHEIQEAVLLSDRILIMSRDSGQIKRMVSNKMKRPRRIEDPQFPGLYKEVLDLL